jgi:hypothetical protein
MDNYVHDNNNAFVPAAGAAAAGPVGTGMSISGARDNTIMHNRFVNNGAWGVIFVPYPDTETPPSNVPACSGGISLPANVCYYDDWGNALIDNTFTHNGFFGNASNGDFAEITALPGPSNCFRGNRDTGGQPTSSPPVLQQSRPICTGASLPDPNPVFTLEVLCDSQFLGQGSTPCLPGMNYPRSHGRVDIHPLPAGLPTMPNPCAGVPANPWCPAGPRHPVRHRSRRGRGR